MRIRTSNRRKRRNFWKRKGHVFIVFNRGAYMRLDCGEHGILIVPLNGREQPAAYRKYP